MKFQFCGFADMVQTHYWKPTVCKPISNLNCNIKFMFGGDLVDIFPSDG